MTLDKSNEMHLWPRAQERWSIAVSYKPVSLRQSWFYVSLTCGTGRWVFLVQEASNSSSTPVLSFACHKWPEHISKKKYVYFYLVSLKIIEDTARDQSDIKCHNTVATVVIPQCRVYGCFKHRTQTKLWLFTSVTWWAQYDWLENRVLLSKTKRVRKIRDGPDMAAPSMSVETLWPTCSDILQHWTFAMQPLLAGRSYTETICSPLDFVFFLRHWARCRRALPKL